MAAVMTTKARVLIQIEDNDPIEVGTIDIEGTIEDGDDG